MRTQASTLAITLLLAGTAAAAPAPAWVSAVGPKLSYGCPDRPALELCSLDRTAAAASSFRLASDEEPAAEKPRLTRFTRLAGMFMGRVDAARTGRWRLRFVLDIR